MHLLFKLLVRLCAMFLIITFSFGCSKKEQSTESRSSLATGKTGATEPHELSRVSEVTTELSQIEYLRNEKSAQRHNLKEEDKDKDMSGGTATQGDVVFSHNGRGVAFIASLKGRQYVVHNGKPGSLFSDIKHLVISPDGKRVSYSNTLGNYLQMITDGVAGNLFVDVYDAVYSPDSRHMAYLAEGRDNIMQVVLDGKTIESIYNVVSGDFHFDSDSSKLLYHVRPAGGRDARLVIYDLKSGNKTAIKCLDTTFIMNSAKNRVAAVVLEGDKQMVIDFSVADSADIHKSGLYDDVNSLSLSDDGKSVAFLATRGKHHYLVLNGKEDQLPAELAVAAPPIIKPSQDSAGVILVKPDRYNALYTFHQLYQNDDVKTLKYSLIKEPAYCSQNNSLAFVAMKDGRFFVVMNGKEGPAFDSVVIPMFSPDCNKLVYRARDGARRMVVVADAASNEHHRHQEYEMVFPTALTADGKSVAYGVKDANKLIWKVDKL